jgi:predicted nucleic acid-binding protein
VTRFVLDTNIVCNCTKPRPSKFLLDWMGEQADHDLYISSLSLGEIFRGILDQPSGKKRTGLQNWFAGPEGPRALFAGRILSFDAQAGLIWANFMAQGKRAGRPRSALDMVIAAVAKTNDCTIATDNEKDFWGIDYVNPMKGVIKS